MNSHYIVYALLALLPKLFSDLFKASFMCAICTRVQICTRGANLHPGCIFGHVNGVLRNLHQFAPGCKFAPAFEVVQIYLHPGANLHPGADCAHERKLYNFYTF